MNDPVVKLGPSRDITLNEYPVDPFVKLDPSWDKTLNK